MSAPTIDFSGLPLLESAVAQLQAQSLTAGGEIVNAVYAVQARGSAATSLAPGSQSSTYTVAQLIQRVQAILLALQTLPQ